MALKIAQLGQPVLRKVAEEVPLATIKTPAFQEFLDQMYETLYKHRGVGLAAPQVFSSQRVFLAAIDRDPDKDRGLDVEVFINPRITFVGDEKLSAWEGWGTWP